MIVESAGFCLVKPGLQQLRNQFVAQCLRDSQAASGDTTSCIFVVPVLPNRTLIAGLRCCKRVTSVLPTPEFVAVSYNLENCKPSYNAGLPL